MPFAFIPITALQSPPPAPLPSAPESLPMLGPSEALLDVVSISTIAFVVFGAGLLANRVLLLDRATARGRRGRLIAIVGMVCVIIGSAAALWWAGVIDVSAARTQAYWVVGGSAWAVTATASGVVIAPERTALVTLSRVLVVPGALVAVSGLVYLGHARTAEPAVVALGADLAHLIAAAIWTGGVGVVAAASVGRAAIRGNAVTDLLRRFSALAAGSVVMLGVTGVVLGTRIAGSLEQLFDGDRGVLLLAKLVLSWTAVVLASANGLVFAPKARRTGRWGPVSRTVSIELPVLFAVLVVAALLSNEAPVAH